MSWIGLIIQIAVLVGIFLSTRLTRNSIALNEQLRSELKALKDRLHDLEKFRAEAFGTGSGSDRDISLQKMRMQLAASVADLIEKLEAELPNLDEPALSDCKEMIIDFRKAFGAAEYAVVAGIPKKPEA